MINTVQIQCPSELLISLQINSETFAETIKQQAAIALFKQGKISSGMAARWLEMPRVTFLMQAMAQGAELLENSQDDFARVNGKGNLIMSDIIIHTPIESQLKQEAETILKKLGLNPTEAIALFYQQICQQKQLPFAVKEPNQATQQAMRDADQGLTHKAKSIDDLFDGI